MVWAEEGLPEGKCLELESGADGPTVFWFG